MFSYIEGEYTAIAIMDDGEAVALVRKQTYGKAYARAQKFSEAFGVICYVFKLDHERHTRYVVKSFFKGRPGNGKIH